MNIHSRSRGQAIVLLLGIWQVPCLTKCLSRGHPIKFDAPFAQSNWLFRLNSSLFLPLMHDLCSDLFDVVDSPLLGSLLGEFFLLLPLLLC